MHRVTLLQAIDFYHRNDYFIQWVEIYQLCVLYKSWMGDQYLHMPDLGFTGAFG